MQQRLPSSILFPAGAALSLGGQRLGRRATGSAAGKSPISRL